MTDERLSLRNHAAFISYSELIGRRVTPDFLITAMRRYGREAMFVRLAVLAASMANDGVLNPFIQAVTRRALQNERPGSALTHFVATRGLGRPVLHERGIYFLQALALLEGNDSTDDPTDADLAEIVIVSNDYFGDWESDAPTIVGLERNLANMARDSRYNRGADLLADFVRNWTIFETPIPNGPLASPEKRAALELTAFGMPLARYLEEVAGPVVLAAGLSGRRQNGGTIKAPVTDPEQWFGSMKAGHGAREALAAELVLDVDKARATIERGVDGLPKTPMCLFDRPLVRFAPNRLVAASPWLVREQLRLGIWGRLRGAATTLFGTRGGEIWTRTFGDLFEVWARRRASQALANSPAVRAIVADRAGTGELEDVVIVGDGRAALFSVKARLLPGKAVKGATDPNEIVKWYRSVLLAAANGDRRAGALHLLDASIRRARRGESPDVARDARIYPILVTFEELGDGPVLYKWTSEECAALGILQDPNAAPLCFLSADDYEAVLAFAARGGDLFELLDARGSEDDGLARMDVLLRERIGNVRPRVPQADAEYRKLVDRICRSSFGVSLARLRTARGKHPGQGGHTPPRPKRPRKPRGKKW